MPVNRAAGATGLACLGAAWLAPWPASPDVAFTAHMLRHLLVVAGAAPLLAMALVWRPAAPTALILAAVPASVVELVVVWLWHTPRLHHLARTDTAAHVLEQTSFLAAGLLLWLAVIAGMRGTAGRAAGVAVIALVLTLAHMTLLGALLLLAPRPLYGHGVAALADQQRGGALMLAVGTAVYLGAGVVAGWHLLRADAAPAEAVP